jgi:HTH-type transcriptional regulator / antitoxin HigA
MTVREAKALKAKDFPARFGDLLALLPPHVIRDESDYDAVIAFLDKLLSRPKMTKGQTDFFETWSVLVASYEAEHHSLESEGITGLDAVKHLLDENGMNASELGELLGNRSLGSKILRGERELSKTHLRILADRFRVNAAIFL